MEADDGEVRLSDFLRLVKTKHEDERSHSTVEETVRNILATREVLSLDLDEPFLNDSTDESAFNALVSSGKIEDISLNDVPQGSRLLVRAASQIAPSLQNLVIFACPMDTLEAQQIFQVLEHSQTLNHVMFYLRHDHGDGVIAAFSHFIRNSQSLKDISLHYFYPGNPQTNRASLKAFKTVCDAVADSRSLDGIDMGDPPVDEAHWREAAESLANAMANCSSFSEIRFYPHQEEAAQRFAKRVCHALARTSATTSFDLSFLCGSRYEGRQTVVTLSRPSPWKPFLTQDIRLNLWPLILAETKFWDWRRSASHKNVDILFHLVKEKCDILFQNIHRRRIRKRKRYGFDA